MEGESGDWCGLLGRAGLALDSGAPDARWIGRAQFDEPRYLIRQRNASNFKHLEESPDVARPVGRRIRAGLGARDSRRIWTTLGALNSR